MLSKLFERALRSLVMPLVWGAADRIANETGFDWDADDEQRKQNAIEIAQLQKEREHGERNLQRINALLSEINSTKQYMSDVIESHRIELEKRKRNQQLIFFEKEIIRTKEEFGAKYFVKEGFSSVLKDLSPQIERKYYSGLKIADDFGLFKMVSELIDLEEEKKAISIENTRKQFIDESGLDLSVGSAVFWAFLYISGFTDLRLGIEEGS
jgi:hypothetical protein